MKLWDISRYALSSCAAFALLTGCGGSQPGIGAPGLMPRGLGTLGQANRSGSWMVPEAKATDLLYATGGCAGTCVLSYPEGKFVGALAYAGYANCSDNNGNVFIPMQESVVELAHGGTSPIATYPLPHSPGVGCAVDPVSGDLAVVNDVFVTVFASGTGTPTTYNSLIDPQYCGYDSTGDLFVSGFDGGNFGLSELPHEGSGLEKLTLDQSVANPGQLQWDGQHMTWESQEKGQPKISRLSISGTAATVVGRTIFRRIHALSLSWIYQGSVIAPYTISGASRQNIGVWKYPRGGAPTERIKTFGSYDKQRFNFTSVTISVKPSHR